MTTHTARRRVISKVGSARFPLHLLGTVSLCASVAMGACKTDPADDSTGGAGGALTGGTSGSGSGGATASGGVSTSHGGAQSAAGGAGSPSLGGANSTEGGSGGAGGVATAGASANGTEGGAAGAGGDSGCGPATNYEPNDAPAQACLISPQVPVESKLNAPADAQDYFYFEAEKGVIYTLEVLNTSAVGGFDEQIHLSAELQVLGVATPLLGDTGVYANGSSFVELKPLESGRVVVKLASASAATYRLQLVSSAAIVRDPDTFEPNNTPSSAAPLALNQVVDSELKPPSDPVDYFRLPVQKGHKYAITNSVSAGIDNVTLTGVVVDDAGGQGPQFVADGTGPMGTRYFEFQATLTGSALFHLTAPGAATYEFVVYPSTADGLVHDAVTFEPNNTPASATPLPLGTELQNTLKANVDYVDYFQADVSTGVSYKLSVSNVTGLSLAFGITGSLDGAELFTHSGPGSQEQNRVFTFTPASSGQALFLLDQPSASGTYRIQLVQQ